MFCVVAHVESAAFPSAFMVLDLVFVGKCEVFVTRKPTKVAVYCCFPRSATFPLPLLKVRSAVKHLRRCLRLNEFLLC